MASGGAAGRGRRVRVLLFGAVAVALLTACSDTSRTSRVAEPTPSVSATPTAEPTPTSTHTARATPSTDPSQVAGNVTYWFDSGGESQLVSVINAAAEIRASHHPGAELIDFSTYFPTVHEAQKYRPIPDGRTQAAWSTALKHLNNGAGDVYEALPHLGTGQSMGPEQEKQEARGWKEFGEGIKGLKAVQARLHRSFGLVLLTDPWEVTPEVP